MIAMLDTSQDFLECQKHLGGAVIEQLFTPLTRFLPQDENAHFAIDNGAFSRFNSNAYIRLLKREQHRKHLCRFAAVPDVVGSARRTVEVFHRWKKMMEGWPLALVCQNGQEDLEIPWDEISAVFIGGDTEWKLSSHAVGCIKAAQALGKWVHVGRVNTGDRWTYFEGLGVDSVDGSGIARFTDTRQRLGNEIKQHKLEL